MLSKEEFENKELFVAYCEAQCKKCNENLNGLSAHNRYRLEGFRCPYCFMRVKYVLSEK